MRNKLASIVLAGILCSCASLTTLNVERTDDVRNRNVDMMVETVFRESRQASARNQYLEITVEKLISKEESFQRRYIENRKPKIGTRLGLWLLGGAIAGVGYTEFEQGYVVLGRDMMGLGLITPIVGNAVANKEIGEQWRDETRGLPDEIKVATRVPVRVTLNDSSWTVNTDVRGVIRLDISKFADAVDLGKPIRAVVTLVDDPNNKTNIYVPSSVVAYHRTPPAIQFATQTTTGEEGVSPVSIPVTLSSVAGLDATVSYSVTGGTAKGDGLDYILESGSLTIPASDTSATIDILITDDAAVEGDESILVSLSRPMNATLGGNTMHTHIIVDNDEALPVTVISAGNIPTIAILDFQGIGVSAQEAMVLTNRLATKMVALGTYQVIERGQMEQILQEQDFQLTGCTTSECAVEIGQLIGAQQMLAGSFGKLGTVYTIDMKIIDVETGRILKTTSYDIEGSINRLLSEGLAEAVRRIANTD